MPSPPSFSSLQTILTDEHLLELTTVASFEELAERTHQLLDNHGIEQVALISGPVTTGGLGHRLANALIFDLATRHLEQELDDPVFPALLFEPVFDKLLEKFQIDGYPYELINDFFGGLIRHHRITTIYLLPDRESSTGAKIEHEIAKQTGTPVNQEKLANYQFLPDYLRYQIEHHNKHI